MEVGIDIEEIARIKKAHKRWGDRFIRHIFTHQEAKYCFSLKDPYPSLAARFCAKEATIKALKKSIPFNRIEIVKKEDSSPSIQIDGKPTNLSVSLSHSKDHAVAIVIKP